MPECQSELDGDEIVGESLNLGEVCLGDRCVVIVGAYKMTRSLEVEVCHNTCPLFSYHITSRILSAPWCDPYCTGRRSVGGSDLCQIVPEGNQVETVKASSVGETLFG